MTNPLYLALDVPQLEAAKSLAERVKAHVGGFKLGLEFFCAHGHHGIHEIAHVGLPIFLDLKFHDIPNTVAGAMQAVHMLEPAIVTVHTSGGRAMMEDAKAAAANGTRVVGVTLLTSLDERDLRRAGVDGTPHEVGPGQALCIRRGAVHRFDNNGSVDAKALCVASPAAIGPQYFLEIAEVMKAAAGGPPDKAKLVEVMRRHGLTPAA